MYKGLDKFFKGTLFVFIDINIGIDILPDFIGFFLIASGCKHLYDEYKYENMKQASSIFILLGVLSFLLMFTIMIPGFKYIHILSLIYSLLLILGYTFFYESIDIDRSYLSMGQIAIVSQLVMSVVSIFHQYLFSSTYQTVMIFLTIVTFIIIIIWLFNIRKLRNQYDNY